MSRSSFIPYFIKYTPTPPWNRSSCPKRGEDGWRLLASRVEKEAAPFPVLVADHCRRHGIRRRSLVPGLKRRQRCRRPADDACDDSAADDDVDDIEAGFSFESVSPSTSLEVTRGSRRPSVLQLFRFSLLLLIKG